MSTPAVAAEAQKIDVALEDLSAGVGTWAGLGLGERRALLEEMHTLVGQHAEEWADAAVHLKGLDPDSQLVGEEWLSGPYALLTGLAALIRTMRALEQGHSPVDGIRFGTAPGGRVSVPALPASGYDSLLLSGFSADVWMPPGVSEETVRAQAGLAELHPGEGVAVSAVLGAGNISAIAPLDVLYELYANNRVVALKLNPIMDELLPVFEQVFAPFTTAGLVRLLTGGADIGGYLVQHDLVQHVHMTGSAVTHDAIVWGRGDDAVSNKAARTPLLDKDITSELGGVSPTIILPGTWSKADLRFQAEHVATQRLHNGGYNCIAGQVVVLSSDWTQKDDFLAELRSAFERAPRRTAYYPGSDDRVSDARSHFPEALDSAGRVLVTGPSDPAEREYLLQTEFFAPVLGVIELPGIGAEFLGDAVRTANDEFTGTLGANVLAHPATIRSLGEQFEQAIADLRYGTIAINAWTGVGFLTANASWGAFPGHTLGDVQSGIGVVHNALLLDSPERTVVRGPFRPSPRSLVHGEMALSPKPPYFVTNRTAAATTRALTRFAAAPGPGKLPAVLWPALRG